MTHTRRDKANFKAWEIEMFGRSLKARVLTYAKNVKDMYLFYREMYGGKDRKK